MCCGFVLECLQFKDVSSIQNIGQNIINISQFNETLQTTTSVCRSETDGTLFSLWRSDWWQSSSMGWNYVVYLMKWPVRVNSLCSGSTSLSPIRREKYHLVSPSGIEIGKYLGVCFKSLSATVMISNARELVLDLQLQIQVCRSPLTLLTDPALQPPESCGDYSSRRAPDGLDVCAFFF